MLKVLQEKTTAPSPGTTRSSPCYDGFSMILDSSQQGEILGPCDDNDEDDAHQGKRAAHLQALLIRDKVEPSVKLLMKMISILISIYHNSSCPGK